MISLKSFIPEIKIVPNTGQPRIGLKWQYAPGYDVFGQVKFWIIGKIENDIIYYKNLETPDTIYINEMSIQKFIDLVRNRNIKIIK